MRRFQSHKDKQLVKSMFYKNIDILPTLQQKISYLLMVLDNIDSNRLNKYLFSSINCQTEPQTDTSLLVDENNDNREVLYNNEKRFNKKLNQSPIRQQQQRNSLSILKQQQQLNNYPNYSPTTTISNKQQHRLSHNNNNLSQQNISKYYSQSNMINNSQTDQSIISTLYNSNHPHLYKDLVNLHRQRKSQAQLSTASSMIQNQKILHQLKKLQMEKQLLKYQNKHISYSHQYSQTLNHTSINQQRINNNQYKGTINNKLYGNDFIEQKYKQKYQQNKNQNNQKDNNKFYDDGNSLLNKLQNKYLPNNNMKQAHFNNNNSSSVNTNDLFSFRPASNNKKINNHKNYNNNKRSSNQVKQYPSSNKKQTYQQRNKQQLKTNQQLTSSLNNNNNKVDNKQSNINNQQLLNSNNKNRQSTIVSEQDQWLIQRLNKNIHNQNYLSTIINNNNMKPSIISSNKQQQHIPSSQQYNQTLYKLQKLQQQRFITQKQTQFKNNPLLLKQTLSDRALKQKLKGFKSWLQHQSITNNLQSSQRNCFNSNSENNNMMKDMSDLKRIPKFKFFNTEKDLNEYGEYVDRNINQLSNNSIDDDNNRGYICYSQSQLQSLTQLYNKQMKIKQQNINKSKSKSKNKLINHKNNYQQLKVNKNKDRLFNKKPQLIINQINSHFNNSRKNNNMSKLAKNNNKNKQSCSKSKSLSRSLSRQRMNRNKQIQHIYYSPKHYTNTEKSNKHKQNNNKLSDYLPKSSNNQQHNIAIPNNNNKYQYDNNQLVDEKNQYDNNELLNEKNINNRVLKRVKSSPYMVIEQMPYSRQKQSLNQLLNRYQLDNSRKSQIKHQILYKNQYLKNNYQQQQEQQGYNQHHNTPYGTY